MTFSKMPLTHLNYSAANLLPVGVQVQQAQGCTLTGSDGTVYLDFTAGWGTALLGYHHARLQAALEAQLAGGFPHPAGLRTSPAWQILAEQLHDSLPAHLNRIHSAPDGHSALRQAMTMARQLTGRQTIISLHPAADTPVEAIPIPFPRPEGLNNNTETVTTNVAAVAAATIATMQAEVYGKAAGDDVAAVVVPAGLGPAAGCALLPPAVLAAVHDFCDRQGLLIILDERETAGGRTGRVFAALDTAAPNMGEPDMIVLGGPLMAGLPPGLLLLPDALAARGLPVPAGGDALGAAAAGATLAALQEEGLLNAATERGAQLKTGLQALQAVYPFFGDIRGEGLFISVDIGVPGRGPDADLAHRIQTACLDRGLILQVGGLEHNVLAWLPPLVVSESEIATALDSLDDALEEIFED